MTAQEFIKSEMQRREELVMDVNFRELCAKAAKKMGVTAEEWNENKVHILLYFANKACGIENELRKTI